MTALLVLLVLLAALVAVAWAPARARPEHGSRRRWHGRTVARVRGLRRRRDPPVDLAAVVTEVASRLRTGLPPHEAWERTVGRLVAAAPGAATAAAPAAATAADGRDGTDLPAALLRLAEHCAGDPGAAAAVRTAVAATRLTRTLGAPLAEVLDRCAASVTEAEQARDARRVALAGPRSTARILTGLPLLGPLLGAGLGADPVAVATDGGWGSAGVLLGVVLVLVGWRWVRLLVAAAERPAVPVTHRVRRGRHPAQGAGRGDARAAAARGERTAGVATGPRPR